jgi:hypothetical protein
LASPIAAPFFCRSPLDPAGSQSRCIPVHGCLETGLCARLHAPFISPRLSRQMTLRCWRPCPHFALHCNGEKFSWLGSLRADGQGPNNGLPFPPDPGEGSPQKKKKKT